MVGAVASPGSFQLYLLSLLFIGHRSHQREHSLILPDGAEWTKISVMVVPGARLGH